MTNGLTNRIGPWVTGNDFFNRKSEVPRLIELLDEGNNILIVAPRRVGKTSLVREAFRRMEQREKDYLLFVDVQHCSTAEEVITTLSLMAEPIKGLWEKVKDAFGTWLKKIPENIESIGSGDLLEITLREGLAGDWQAKGRKIIQNMSQADRPVTICFDELPIMLSRMLKAKNDDEYQIKHRNADIFLSWLRHMMGEYQKQIRFIICGSIGLEPILKRHKLVHTITQMRAFHLEPWSRETADECLVALAKKGNLTFNEEARQALLAFLHSYVPHHVQMFFGHVYDDCGGRGNFQPTTEDVTRVYYKFMLGSRGHAELIDYETRLERVLSPDCIPLAIDFLTAASINNIGPERLRALAANHGLNDNEENAREILEVLEHDGYLEWHENEKEWRFVSHLIRDWWKRRFGQTCQEPEGKE